MHDIFVSYSHEDKPIVRKLVACFEEQGWSVWWDDKIQVGRKYSRLLDEAMDHSRCVVACWSSHSLKSEYVRSEAHRGDARRILVPVFLEHVDLPGPFDEYNVSDLSRWPDEEAGEYELQKLLRDLQGRLALASTPIPVDTSSYVPGFDGRPAIAILPFKNDSEDASLAYVCSGISEDINDRLQRFRSFPVISNSTTINIDPEIDFITIADHLGVDYLVSGSIRKLGPQYRIRVELSKTPHFDTIWSVIEDVESFDDFALQDEFSLKIAAQLEPELERVERRLSLPIRTSQSDVWHLVRRAVWNLQKLTREGAAEAKRILEEALSRDPDSTETLVQLGWWHFWDISYRRGEPEDWLQCADYARRATNIDPRDSRPLTLLGISEMMQSNHVEARNYFQRAIDLNPSYAWTYAHMGTSLYLDSQPEESLVYTTMAVRLSPMDFFLFHAYCDMAVSKYMQGHYSSALEAANYSLGLRAGYWLAHVIKVCTLVRIGRVDEAKSALAKLTSRKSNISMRDIDWLMFSDRKWNAELANGLKKAGWAVQ